MGVGEERMQASYQQNKFHIDLVEMSGYTESWNYEVPKEIQVCYILRKEALEVMWINEAIKENVDIFDHKRK